jgi:hypothetical protein
VAIPKPRVISNNPRDLSPVLLFGNLSQTNYYQVNFTGFGGNGQTGGLSKLSSYLKRFPSEDNGVDLKFITEGVGFLCSEATLPGSSLATAEVKDNFMGIQQEFAHTRLYSDIDFTFYVDTNYNTLKFFEGWIDFISSASEMDSITNSDQGEGSLGAGRLNSYYYRRMMWPDDYKCNTMSITKFEKDYGRSIHYLFINAFPKLVTAVPVSYGAADILRVSVSFNYDRYVINPPTGQFETNKKHEFNISRKDSSELRSLDISKANSLKNPTSDALGGNRRSSNPPAASTEDPRSTEANISKQEAAKLAAQQRREQEAAELKAELEVRERLFGTPF